MICYLRGMVTVWSTHDGNVVEQNNISVLHFAYTQNTYVDDDDDDYDETLSRDSTSYSYRLSGTNN
jgi:hypothetical protein